MTGVNNIALEQYDITGHYREIVRDLAASYKRPKIVIQSILPVTLAWIGNNVIKDINPHLEQIAHEYGAAYLELYALFVDAEGNPGSEYLQDDGVHLSGKGYEIWANEVEKFLKNIS